jgi:hypothetical protein
MKKQYNFRIEPSLMEQFKTKCAMKLETVSERIRELIKEDIKK